MKYFVILLLGANLEQIELPKHASLTCQEAGDAWRDIHTTYRPLKVTKNHGWYTKKGELFVGYYCK